MKIRTIIPSFLLYNTSEKGNTLLHFMVDIDIITPKFILDKEKNN